MLMERKGMSFGFGLSCLRHVVQHEQLRTGARRDGVGTALIVAELHQHRVVVERLDDRADLTPGKPVRRNIGQRRNDTQ